MKWPAMGKGGGRGEEREKGRREKPLLGDAP